jgi:hypothetical protein
MNQIEKVDRFRAKNRDNRVWYSGAVHILFNATCLIGTTIGSLFQISDLKPLELFTIPVMLIAGNLAVYLIHRYPLHTKYPYIHKGSYGEHTLFHHRFYTNENFQVMKKEDVDTNSLFFPPVVVIVFCLIFIPSLYFILNLFLPTNIVFLALGMSSFYFILYETVHYTSHLPENHWVLRISHLQRMRQHHMDHHNPKHMSSYNFNIVFPLFDHVFGTCRR